MRCKVRGVFGIYIVTILSENTGVKILVFLFKFNG